MHVCLFHSFPVTGITDGLFFVLIPFQNSVQSHLVSLQPQFKTNLLESVDVYKHDLTSFLDNYSQMGHAGFCFSVRPNVPCTLPLPFCAINS